MQRTGHITNTDVLVDGHRSQRDFGHIFFGFDIHFCLGASFEASMRVWDTVPVGGRVAASLRR